MSFMGRSSVHGMNVAQCHQFRASRRGLEHVPNIWVQSALANPTRAYYGWFCVTASFALKRSRDIERYMKSPAHKEIVSHTRGGSVRRQSAQSQMPAADIPLVVPTL